MWSQGSGPHLPGLSAQMQWQPCSCLYEWRGLWARPLGRAASAGGVRGPGHLEREESFGCC